MSSLTPQAPTIVGATDGFAHWWLPDNYSTHGGEVDALFWATTIITVVTFVLVQAVLIWFLIKYRRRPGREKGIFSHGNTRLEMAWTISPAVILAVLAVWNKGVWDRMRFFPEDARGTEAKVLVIGQQFKWHVIYPGPDGEFGRYLIFPQPTDKAWPGGSQFRGVPGPAYLPYDEAVQAINAYIDGENPLGKDFADPRGVDDDWTPMPGRDVNVPVDRPVEVHLTSKDVIHSFYLPNMRVKLDAVPGMRSVVHFTATKTSKQIEQESRQTLPVDQIIEDLKTNPTKLLYVTILPDAPGAVRDERRNQWLYQDQSDPDRPRTIVRDGALLPLLRAEQLKAAGIDQVTVYEPGIFEIVCEELCGAGHATMRGQLAVLEQEAYARTYEGATDEPPPQQEQTAQAE